MEHPMNTTRALRFVTLAIAAGVGHEVADYITGQTDLQAREKAHPDYNITPGVPYWRTWWANQKHCAAYHVTLAAAVAAVAAPLGVKVHPRRAAAALALSWLTHGVIDRRWPVEQLMKATGSAGWYPVGVPQVDQALHRAIVMFAALVASAETPSITR
jgi:hypothetical protein